MDHDEATRQFYDLVWPHLPVVLRAARILTGCDAEAEDLAQDTMLKAFRGIAGFAPGTDVKAWLYTILRRARIDRIRSSSGSHGVASLDEIEHDPVDREHREDGAHVFPGWHGGADELLNEFSDQQVIDALQELPEDIRLTLLLVDVEQVTMEEAARILEVPVGTVKSRSHRGRAMLRRALLPVARELRLVRD